MPPQNNISSSFPIVYEEQKKFYLQNYAFVLIFFLAVLVFMYFFDPTRFVDVSILWRPPVLFVVLFFGILVPILAFAFMSPGKITLYEDHFEYEKGGKRITAVWNEIKSITLVLSGKANGFALRGIQNGPNFFIKTDHGNTRIICPAYWIQITPESRSSEMRWDIERLSGKKSSFQGIQIDNRIVVYFLLLIMILMTVFIVIQK